MTNPDPVSVADTATDPETATTPETATAKLSVNGVSRVFQQPKQPDFQALKDVSFEIEAGGFYTLIGHSGCGKSTLLNIVAGLDEANAGEIRVDGQLRHDPGPDRGMVFQSYTLFPWLSVLDNVAFGLKMRGISEQDRRDQAMNYLQLVKLEQFANAYPRQLSGGMRQRVALARAIANKPDVLLMDEPFGALDAETREHMHELLLSVREREFMTVLFITHDIEEAILLSRRIGIMAARPGRITQEFVVDLPEQRNADLKLSDAFLHNKRQVIDLFKRA